MKPCSQYRAELAACASPGHEISSNLAAHLSSCACCGAAFTELRQAAELQDQAAAQLRIPDRSIHLATWFFQNRQRTSQNAQRRRLGAKLAFSGVAAFALLFVMLTSFYARRSPVPRRETAAPARPSSAAARSEAAFTAPSWHAFREELRSGDLTLNLGIQPSSSGSTQYRLKDAYAAYNN